VPLPTADPAPRAVRIAGLLVALQGLTGVAFAVAVLVRAFGVATGAGNLYGEFGYYAVLSAAILAVAGGLLLGRRWARTPAALLQLLLIAVAWYAIGPSQLAGLAIVTVIVCVLTLILLFIAPSRAWAVADSDRS
jgi:hypothetical protein